MHSTWPSTLMLPCWLLGQQVVGVRWDLVGAVV
jgi:hypothetical protein